MVDIGVVHLVWVPAGPAPFQRFLTSYQRHAAGVPHELTILYNGHSSRQELLPFRELLSELRCQKHFEIQERIIDPPYQDIRSYRYATETIQRSHLCFLNSYTELRCQDWLWKLYKQLCRPGIGVVGATGSWETFIPPLAAEYARLNRRSLLSRLRGYLRLTYQQIRYPSFPNPHIRTNGFMISRENLRSLRGASPRNKREAWSFENGWSSMTRQIHSRGMRPLVVGADGTGYEIAEWPHSNTFRQGNQSNLMMADNRTRQYEEGNREEQRRLWIAAWQEEALDPLLSSVAIPRARERETGAHSN